MDKLDILISKLDKLRDEIAKLHSPVAKEWLRTKDAAEYLGISETQLHSFKRQGVLPHSKMGGSLYYRKCDIDQILEKNLQEVS